MLSGAASSLYRSMFARAVTPPASTATAAPTSPTRAPAGEAQRLRDAAFDAHVPVAGGEGVKRKDDLRADCLPAVRQELAAWGRSDASRMVALPTDPRVTLRAASFEYHSGRPMEAWLDAVPVDRWLDLKVVTCVSGHDGLPHARFATENVYVAHVAGPTGSLQGAPFGPGVSQREEYASVSPPLRLDLTKPGDYVVTCAPRGSAGTGGYVEARKLVLHVTGREPTL
ncbi:MAG: hypothetical protein FJ137_08105 [Deltaproteobacteria bacterium]|nr:hypothetical protein [Deltaproteobacteria bacterium]